MTNFSQQRIRAQRRPRLSIRQRGGYAMLTVLVLITTLSSWYAIAYQRAAGALRQQRVQALQRSRDTGAVQALATTLALLETGFPPTTPYVAGVNLDTPTG